MAKFIFVTVGSTRFDDLVAAVGNSNVVAMARTKGYSLIMQHGTSPLPKDFAGEHFDYTSDIHSYYAKCDIVISHAGSGTAFEVLRGYPTKKLILVPNPDLADNHQQELAAALSIRGHCLRCSPMELGSAIEHVDDFQPMRLPSPDTSLIKAIFSVP
jgi:beta-1,4-N-acetylglucosaminyltransferase